MLDSAARSVVKLGEKIEESVDLFSPIACVLNLSRIKTTDAAKLQDEYAKLVEGLQDAVDDGDTDGFMANPRNANTSFIFLRGTH